MPPGAKCVPGAVEYISFSYEKKASRLAYDVRIGDTKLCTTCQLKPTLYGNFADKIEVARIEGLDVMNYGRMRP